MIRAGTRDDLLAIVEMAEEFWQHTAFDEPCDPATVWAMAENCIASDMMAVLDIGGEVVGFACGVVGPLLGNSAVLTGTELAWWVSPAHRSGRNGIALLKKIEQLARVQGVKYWNMVYMESSMPEEVRGIYERLGYRRAETVYTREL